MGLDNNSFRTRRHRHHHRCSRYYSGAFKNGFAGATENHLRGVIALCTTYDGGSQELADDKRLTNEGVTE